MSRNTRSPSCALLGAVRQQKTVVLERDAYGDGSHRFHPGLFLMADDLGVRVRLCCQYWARTKGKVKRFTPLPT